MKRVSKDIVFVLLIAGIASLPLMTSYLPIGNQLQTALAKIELFQQGMTQVFPVRIEPLQSMDYGYQAASFQGDIFLYIPALFRVVGLSAQASYKLFLFFINLVTAAVAAQCVTRCFGRQEIGWIGSMLYTWCPYRCSLLYVEADLGEVIAWCFLPLVLWGITRWYIWETNQKSYGGLWMPVTVGLSLMLSASVTMFLVTVGMVLVICLFQWRRTWQKRTLFLLGKTVVATGVLNLWLLLPLLHRIRSNPLSVGILIPQDIETKGLYLIHYMKVFFRDGASTDFVQNGMKEAQSFGFGVAVTVGVFACLWLLFIGRYQSHQECRSLLSFGKCILITGLFFMLVSSHYFPWDVLQNKNLLLSIVLAWMQSPAKWAVIVALCMIFVTCFVLYQIEASEKENTYKICLCTLGGISFATTQFFLVDILQTRGMVKAEEMLNTVGLQLIQQEPAVWRIGEICSMAAWVALIVVYIVRRRGCVKQDHVKENSRQESCK